MFAAIRPAGKKPGLWALPKGNIGPGEKPDATAIREVEEETGVQASLVTKLGDIRYVYTWAGERVFKVVSFYLLRYSRGRLGEIVPEMRVEVDEARWLPLAEGPQLLAYGGERQMAEHGCLRRGGRGGAYAAVSPELAEMFKKAQQKPTFNRERA